MRVSAIVLAAGESRRMGSQKALIPWEGATLIEYHLSQLGAIDDVVEIIVVTGHQPGAITEIVERHPRARAAHNARYASGKVSSILAGLRAVAGDADAIVLCAVDQPRPAAIMSALIDAQCHGDAAITLPVHEGRRGHPIVFDSVLMSELLAIDEASMGIRAVIERDPERVKEVAIDDPSVLLDVNRPEDLPA